VPLPHELGRLDRRRPGPLLAKRPVAALLPLARMGGMLTRLAAEGRGFLRIPALRSLLWVMLLCMPRCNFIPPAVPPCIVP